MQTRTIDEIYAKDFDIKEIFAMYQVWKPEAVFEMKKPRANSALLYVDVGTLTYTDEKGKLMTVESGYSVYIPKGAVYTTRFSTDSDTAVTLLCQFETVDEDGEPFTFFPELTSIRTGSIKNRYEDLINACCMPIKSPAMLKSICFGIMSDTLLCAKNISLKNSAAFSSIRKGIMYLENDPVQDKRISEIAEMCNVSESGFSRLFKLYSGYAPGEYRLNEKINRAKKLLSSHTMTVEEVSSSLGFTECGYFCKLFKKKTGVSPGKYMNMN